MVDRVRPIGAAPRRRSLAGLLAALSVAGLGVLGTTGARAVPTPTGSAGTIQTMGGVTINFQQGGDGPDEVPATQSQFNNPRGVVFAPNGDAFIADALNNKVRRIDSTGVVHLVADGLSQPNGVAVDSQGNVYIADTGNCVIRMKAADGTISTFAGTGAMAQTPMPHCQSAASDANGPALSVNLNTPTSLFVSTSGGNDTLWISDTGGNALRKVVLGSANPQLVRVAGGNSSSRYGGDGGPAASAALRQPTGVWVAADGTVYLSDGGNNLVRKISNDAQRTITTIAGDVAAAAANATTAATELAAHSDDGDGGSAVDAHLDEPRGITGDNRGNLYVAEEHGARIRRINLNTGHIDTIAGDGTVAEQRANGGSYIIQGENGPALQTQFNHLHDIAVNPSDSSLWIADSRDNRVRAIADAADAPGAVVPTGGGTSPPPTTTTTGPTGTTTTTHPTTTTTSPTTTTTSSTTTTTTTGPTTTTTTTGPTTTTTTTRSPAPPGSDIPSGTAGTAGAGGSGYWMVTATGRVYGFGVPSFGDAATASATHIEADPAGAGYWVLDAGGRVYNFGAAAFLGNATLKADEKAVSLSATPDGKGYWIFTDNGRVFPFGTAAFHGDVRGVRLNGPILGSVATPDGGGYWMVGSDGGIFSFGNAAFHGSTGNLRLNKPVMAMAPAANGAGYWLVASDGGIFAFDVPFYGSMGGTHLNKPVAGMVPGRSGYLMVGQDGGTFAFGDVAFHGSLGASPPASPVVSVALVG